MGRKIDIVTTALAASLVVGALMACKKKEEPPPAESAATPPPPPPSASAAPADPKEVKRYADKEVPETGTVRVLKVDTKVFKEADISSAVLATLSRGTLVNRKARFSTFTLIEYPSGVGELSPGWVLATEIEEKVQHVSQDAVKKQVASAAPSASAPPATSAAATAPPPAPAPAPAPRLPQKPNLPK